MAVKSKRLRFEILKRDRFTCRYCGQRPPSVVLHVDHIVPEAEGGTDDPANLTAACFDCNSGKSSIGLGSRLPEVDYEREVERLEQARQLVELLAAERQSRHEAALRVIDHWLDHHGTWAPADAETTIERWLDHLTEADLIRLIDLTHSRTRGAYWRYFCGCVWRTIKEGAR